MRLSEYLQPRFVLLGLETTGVEDTLRAFVERVAETHAVEQPGVVEKALLDRESSHTTSLGNGVALPHATVPGLDRPMILVGVAPNGVTFGSTATPPAGVPAQDRLFFVLLSPLNQAGTHIKLLARIVRLVRDPDFVESLLTAETGEQLIEAIERVDAQHV